MARRSCAALSAVFGGSNVWRAHNLLYANARMPRDAATADSDGSVRASHTNVDALLSSRKYSNSGVAELSGKGTPTPPARHMPHSVATHANPGVTANAIRSS